MSIRNFTGDILSKVRVIDYEGRHFLAHTDERFDVIDLSLADSVGLSNPGGFAIVEKFSYTKEAMETYMRALAPGGVLSVTLWNKEEPPKSILKLYATMAAAARDVDPGHLANSFFVVSSYLSTATVLYKNGGFYPGRGRKAARAHARHVVRRNLFAGLRLRSVADRRDARRLCPADFRRRRGRAACDRTLTPPRSDPPFGEPDAAPPSGKADDGVLPATVMGRLAWHALISGDWPDVASRYVFDTRALTNDAPYFAAYVKTADLPRVLDRLELLQDEWGYLLIWATLGVACLTAAVLLAIPVVWGWRAIFSRDARQGADRPLFRLPRRRLHHGRGRTDRPFRDGARQSDDFRLGADHWHARLFRTGGADFGAHPAAHAHRHAGSVPRDRGAPDPLCAVHQHALDAIGALPYGARLVCCFSSSRRRRS